jgi:parallel beta-helix repeat protein
MVMNLSKNVFTLFLVLCLCSAIIIKNNRVLVNASPSTLMVPDDYKTIQEAINNAGSGDTIFVRKGIYTENIVINKSITLIGEDRESTIIDGRATGNVISIKASNVTIKGFTIRNSDPFVGYGIFIERFGNIVISNNSINNNNIGIQISFSSRNQIYENIISANYVAFNFSIQAVTPFTEMLYPAILMELTSITIPLATHFMKTLSITTIGVSIYPFIVIIMSSTITILWVISITCTLSKQLTYGVTMAKGIIGTIMKGRIWTRMV